MTITTTHTVEIMEHDGEELTVTTKSLEGARLVAKGVRVAIIKDVLGNKVEEYRNY